MGTHLKSTQHKMYNKAIAVLLLVTITNTTSHPTPDFGLSGVIEGVSNKVIGELTETLTNDGGIDKVKELFDTGNNGLGIASKLLEYAKDTVEKVDDFLHMAKESIEQINNKSTTIDLEKYNFTKTFFSNFNSGKIELLSARSDLLSLSLDTQHACENLEILFQYWDDTTPAMIKQQLNTIKRLMNESEVALKTAQEKYKSLLDIWNEIAEDIDDFKFRISEMTDEESEAYGNWTKTLREAVYGTNTAITVGMLIADVFGCLGICSGIVTTTTWTISVSSVETTIADYTAELKALEKQTELALMDLHTLDEACETTIETLSSELQLIRNWSEAVEKVKKSLVIFSADELKEYAKYKDKFLSTISKLKRAAENLSKFTTSDEAQLKLD